LDYFGYLRFFTIFAISAHFLKIAQICKNVENLIEIGQKITIAVYWRGTRVCPIKVLLRHLLE